MKKDKQIEQFLNDLPVWAMIIDKNENITAVNSIAKSLGSKIGDSCFAGVANRKDSCTWCKRDKTLDCNNPLSHSGRVNFNKEKSVVAVNDGGIMLDAHWIPIGNNKVVHFGFVGLLSEDMKNKTIKIIKNFVNNEFNISTIIESIEKAYSSKHENTLDLGLDKQ